MSRITPEPDDLDQRLRDAFKRADLPTAPHRLRTEIESLPATTPRREIVGGRRPWPHSPAVVTLVALAAVIAVIAVALPFLGGRPQVGDNSPSAVTSGPAVTPGRSSSPVASASPQPVVTASDGSSIAADGPSIAWTNVPLAQFGSNRVWAVGAGKVGGTLVVAANDSTQNDMKPVIIVSADGKDWTRVSTAGAEFADARVDFLVPIPGGLLLVGESLMIDPSCPAAAAGCNQAPSVVLMWRSSDGLTWQPLSAAELAPFSRVSVASIASGPKGLAAFGLHDPLGSPAGTFDSVVFHSTDGLHWSSAAFPDQNTSSGMPVEQVVATANGFVAVGESAPWYSTDGLKWTQARMPAGSTVYARYAAAGSAGIVATSFELSPTPYAMWVSADGRTWKTALTSPYTVGSSWIAGDGDQILVISGPSVYWSADGKAWHRGNSTPGMPAADIVGTTSLAWIFSSTVIAVSPDALSLYVGRVAGN
jgi:hypothetical protein